MGFFDFLNSFTDAFGNVITQQTWRVRNVSLREGFPSMDTSPYLTNNFYISSYICPDCGQSMYKTVFRIGEESRINVNGTPYRMKRLFTCPHCKNFYTPMAGKRLSAGTVYFLDSQNDYNKLLESYNACGTTQGRPDA